MSSGQSRQPRPHYLLANPDLHLEHRDEQLILALHQPAQQAELVQELRPLLTA